MENITKKIKCYEIGPDSELLAISLVEEPAVDSSYQYFEKQKQYIALEKSDKHLVYGCALRANYNIYRIDPETKTEYYVRFTPEAIESMSRKYLMSKEDNWTLDHEDETNGISIVESWIKQDEVNDKSVALNLEGEVGSWFIGAYVSNEDVWDEIKNNRWTGFSVEALCTLNNDIINSSNKKDNMAKEKFETIEVNDSFWEKVKALISEALNTKEEDATPEENEAVAEEATEEIKDEADAEKEEETVEEEMAEEPEAPTEEPKAEEDELAKLKEENEALKKANEDLQAEVTALKEELAGKDEKIEKMSKQPSTKPVNVESKNNKNDLTFLDFARGKVRI